MRNRYRGFSKHSVNELDPWDGGTTPTVLLGLLEDPAFPVLPRSTKLAKLREVLREHDVSRDLHERVARMVEAANVPLWIRLQRRWHEHIYETDLYTSYGKRRD
jgi:hypothetical protein